MKNLAIIFLMKLAGTVLAVFGSVVTLNSVDWEQANLIHGFIIFGFLFLLISIGVSIFAKAEKMQAKN